jgi:AraC-like DNA-binding protein
LNQYPLKLIVILTITFNGLFLASLITIGQMISDRKSPKTWLFFLLFSIFCLFQIHYIFFEMGLLDHYIFINMFPITAIYLLGPTLFGITLHGVKHKSILSRDMSWHFGPAIGASLLSLSLLFTTELSNSPVLYGYYYNRYLFVLSGLGTLSFVIYLFLSGRELINSYLLSRKVILENPAVFVAFFILIFLVLALLSDIAALFLHSKVFMECSLFILNLIIIFLFLIVFKYPDYYKAIHVVVKKETQKRSYLKGIDLDTLARDIKKGMEQDRIFTNEDLNLASMADCIGLTRHQLSEYMNSVIGQNFTTFINRHRIEAAKKMLKQRPEENIISIAFEVGFKSKSTFNASFSQFEKTTPHSYRKKWLKNHN